MMVRVRSYTRRRQMPPVDAQIRGVTKAIKKMSRRRTPQARALTKGLRTRLANLKRQR